MSNFKEETRLVKLGESNWKVFAQTICPYLKSKGLWRLVSGARKKPDEKDEDKMEKWLTEADQACGIILLNLEESGIEDPAAMWSTLEAIHVLKKPSNSVHALHVLLSVTKDPEDTLPAVTTKVEDATMDFMALLSKDYTLTMLIDDIKSMALLRSLPEDHASFLSSLTLMDGMTFNKLKEAFLNEQANRNHLALQSLQAGMASASLTQLLCDWCDLPGHTSDNCYAKRDSQRADKAKALQKQQVQHSKNPFRNNKKKGTSSGQAANTVETALNASTFTCWYWCCASLCIT
jgi:hypothetical protein